MISHLSVVLPQILFAQSMREFVRKMARRILPGISLANFQLESDSVFEASINAALSALRDDATEYEQRTAVVVVAFNDVNRLCRLLKQSCAAVRFAKPILEEAGVTTAKEFARIRHAIAVREYRQRMKSLEAKGTCVGKSGNGIMQQNNLNYHGTRRT